MNFLIVTSGLLENLIFNMIKSTIVITIISFEMALLLKFTLIEVDFFLAFFSFELLKNYYFILQWYCYSFNIRHQRFNLFLRFLVFRVRS